MASDSLDTLWDGWTGALSESYARALDFLDRGETAAAVSEFRKTFVWNVKKLYAEAGNTYPVRYANAPCWSDWTKRLYILTRKVEDALVNGDTAAARKLLPELRAHFYELHVQAGQKRVNDIIYALELEAESGNVSVATLKAAQEQMRDAAPSRKAKADAQAYDAARKAWLDAVAPVLAGAQELTENQREQVLGATRTFYQAYGAEFE